jgi:copper chaperone NosL
VNLVRILGSMMVLGGLELAAQAPPDPGPKDKCPVCGMFVAKYPEWIAAARLPDGSWLYFDGAKDGFAFIRNPGKYRPRAGAPTAVFVRDYYRLEWVDAHQAWFVLGSNVLGPMGAELVPFATETGARTFLKDHAGSKLLRFGDVDETVLKGLN